MSEVMPIKSFLYAAVVVTAMSLGLGGCGTDGASGDEGGACGGFRGGECGVDQFCDYPTAECGRADGAGTCQPRPQSCLQDHTPVKGSDGEIYSNECLAHAAGADDCGSADNP